MNWKKIVENVKKNKKKKQPPPPLPLTHTRLICPLGHFPAVITSAIISSTGTNDQKTDLWKQGKNIFSSLAAILSPLALFCCLLLLASSLFAYLEPTRRSVCPGPASKCRCVSVVLALVGKKSASTWARVSAGKVVRSGFCLNLFPTHVLNLISRLLPWHLTMGPAAATPFLYRSYRAAQPNECEMWMKNGDKRAAKVKIKRRTSCRS